MVAAAKKEVQLISIDEFHNTYTKALGVGAVNFTLIDIRTEAEYNDGYIPGTLESKLEKDEVWKALNHAKPKKDEVLILYCRSGGRSALAAKTLGLLGYTNVKSLEGGWKDWSKKYPNLKKLN